MKPILALAVVLPLAACGPYQLESAEVNTARLGAMEYAQRAEADVLGVSGQDSDKDGYVTATIKARKGGHSEVAILCAYRGNPGCKPK